MRALCLLALLASGCIDFGKLDDRLDRDVVGDLGVGDLARGDAASGTDGPPSTDAAIQQDAGPLPCSILDQLDMAFAENVGTGTSVAVGSFDSQTFALAITDDATPAVAHVRFEDHGAVPQPEAVLTLDGSASNPRVAKGTYMSASVVTFDDVPDATAAENVSVGLAVPGQTMVTSNGNPGLCPAEEPNAGVGLGTTDVALMSVADPAWVASAVCGGDVELYYQGGAEATVVQTASSVSEARIATDGTAGYLVWTQGSPSGTYASLLALGAPSVGPFNSIATIDSDPMVGIGADLGSSALVVAGFTSTGLAVGWLAPGADTATTKTLAGASMYSPVTVASGPAGVLVAYETTDGIYGVRSTSIGELGEPFLIAAGGHRPQAAADAVNGPYIVTYVHGSNAALVELSCP